MPHAEPLAPIDSVPQNSQIRNLPNKFLCHCRRPVRRAVVHHNHFRIRIVALQKCRDFLQRPRQPEFLVIRRNNDGELRRRAHAFPASFQPCSPCSGTNLHPSKRLISYSLPRLIAITSSCCASLPTGTIMRPPSFNCSSSGVGIAGAPAATRIASNGANSANPSDPSPPQTC